MARTFTHHHLLGIEQLTFEDIETIYKLAEHYAVQGKSLPQKSKVLEGKTIVNLFFEPSTRTRVSFEIAAKRLGADVVNIAVEHSSTKKGETNIDTVRNLNAMGIDALIIRHTLSGFPAEAASVVKASVLNAGDGINEHPSQALLDCFTMLRHKGSLKRVKVAICGDLAHSRVARSNIHLLHKLGAEVHLIAPPDFISDDLKIPGVKYFDKMNEGLANVDVIMMLRIQHERMTTGEFAMSLKDYSQRYGLDHSKLEFAKKNVIVLHPGPINRDIEISSSLADDLRHSVIHEQVEAGVAIRMALLDLLLRP